MKQKVFIVYDENMEEIDTIFYSPNCNVDANEVKESLIQRDGYDSRITVIEEK